MNRLKHTAKNLTQRKNRVRSTVTGTTERPRLSVYVSNRNVVAQIIDDSTGKTLAATATAYSKDATGSLADKCAFAGADIAAKAKKAKVTKVVLDRNGRRYQKRLAAFADAARENGLEF